MRHFLLASAVMLGLTAALPAAALAAPPTTGLESLADSAGIEQVGHRGWHHGYYAAPGYRYGPPRGYYGRRYYGPPPYGHARGYWRHRHYGYGRPYYGW